MATPAWQGPWFAANSPWNTPIPSDWASHVHSDTASMVQGVYIGTNFSSYDIHAFAYRPAEMQTKEGGGTTYTRDVKWLGPGGLESVVFASNTQPLITVYSDYNVATNQYQYRYQSFQVPLPANWTGYTRPDLKAPTYYERRTAIVCENGDLWVIYQPTPPGDPIAYLAPQTDTFWHTTHVEKIGKWTDSVPGWHGGGSGLPFFAGLLTPYDILNTPVGGHFNHVLCLNTSVAADGSFAGHPKLLWPTPSVAYGYHFSTDGKTKTAVGIPHGARIFLDPSLTDSDLNALGVTKEWQLQIARTMQKYGAISKESTTGQGGAGGIICESIYSIAWNKSQGYYPSTFQWPWIADGTTNNTDRDTSSYNAAFPTALVPTSGSHWQVMDWNDSVPGITVPGTGGGGGGGGGSAAFVKEVGHATPPGTAPALSVAAAPDAGNLLVLSVAWNDVTNTLTSVTDSKGNTWTVDKQVAGATTAESVAIASTTQDAGALTTSDTITLHYPGSLGRTTVACHEFSGMTNTVDQTASNNSVTLTARDAGTTPTTTNANDLIFAAFGINAIETSFTAAAGYTAPAPGFYAQTNSSLMFCYQVVAATGAYHPSGTGGFSFKSVGATVAYKTAAGTPPVNTVAPVVTGSLVTGNPLSTTTGTWTDDGSPSFTYQWQDSANGSTGWANITVATSPVYVTGSGEATKYIRSQVTDTASNVSTTATSNVVGPLTSPGTPPVNTVAPVVTGTAQVGQTLSTTDGTWTDAGSSTITYQWQADTLGNSVYSDIFNDFGSTAQTYTISEAEDGCHVRCVVTDTDVNGSTSANSNAIGLVVEPAPVNETAPVVF